jgi:acetyltransferase-like isoleucine patch superfamily enzyme
MVACMHGSTSSSSREAPTAIRRPLLVRLSYLFYLLLLHAELPYFLPVRRALLNRMLGRLHQGLLVFPDVFISQYDRLRIGRNVTINRGCHLACAGGLTIGDDVAIGHDTSIVTTEHGYQDPKTAIWQQPMSFRSVQIGNNVWIGARVCILAGVTIADGTVVAAGAVVTKSFTEQDTIIGGVPARVLKRRFHA